MEAVLYNGGHYLVSRASDCPANKISIIRSPLYEISNVTCGV